jgi:hypothetical protein
VYLFKRYKNDKTMVDLNINLFINIHVNDSHELFNISSKPCNILWTNNFNSKATIQGQLNENIFHLNKRYTCGNNRFGNNEWVTCNRYIDLLKYCFISELEEYDGKYYIGRKEVLIKACLEYCENPAVNNPNWEGPLGRLRLDRNRAVHFEVISTNRTRPDNEEDTGSEDTDQDNHIGDDQDDSKTDNSWMK